jgi:tyrosine-protein kinase Etk/Wzc
VDDTEKISPYPLLSIIPKYDRKLFKKVNQSEYHYNKLVTMMNDQNQFRESYRVLDLKVRNFSPSGSKALLISSCEENTGKTSIATNFAISLAHKNKKVLLIDGDLRKANVASLLNDSNRKAGLINYLTDNIAHTHIINRLSIDEKNEKSLDYILAGGTVENSSELLESEKFARLIEKLIPKYDHILIDTPPITRIIDTLILGKVVRDLILVIKPNHTYKENIEMAIEELEYANMNVIGYIFNAFDLNKLTGKYKYGYGYAYGYPVSHADNVID